MYEFLYIVSSSFTDPEVQGIMKKVEALMVGEGAEVKKHTVLAKQALAYPIKHLKHGTYVLMHLTLPPSALSKIERTLRLELSDEVLRHLFTKVTEKEAQAAFELLPYTYPLADRERPSAPRKRMSSPRELPPPTPAPLTGEKMSVEELDKKLDEILEDGTLTNV